MKSYLLFPSFATLVALLFATGCARRETDVEAGIRTRTLIVGSGADPGSFDPHVASHGTEWRILTALFEGLTALDERTAQPLPGAAERWDVSPDGLVYTFHLRPNARWSSGDPLTAADFTFSLQRLLLPALGAPGASMLWPIKNAEAFNKGRLSDFAEVGVSAVDAYTLRVDLERPTPYLPSLTARAWMPVHRATIEKHGGIDDRGSTWTRPGNLVGNGPFVLTEWRSNDRIVVRRNPYYWDADRMRLESIVFLPIENPNVEERGFRAGQVHVTWNVPSAKVTSYRARDPVRLRIEPVLSSWFLEFNVNRPPLDQVEVRRALSLAIDREGIVRTAYANAPSPAASFVPPGCGGYKAGMQVPTDFATARRLLAEAGFPEGRGMRAIGMQVGANSPDHFNALQIIQETWRHELGVPSTVEPMEVKVWLQRLQTHDFDISFGGWTADFPDPESFLSKYTSQDINNCTGFANAKYDQLVAQASRTLETNRRFDLFGTAETLFLEEAPIAPLFFGAKTYLVHPSVRNWEPAPMVLRRFQLVWLE